MATTTTTTRWCPRCEAETERRKPRKGSPHGDCKPCQDRRNANYDRTRRQSLTCRNCGATDRDKTGNCRPCEAARNLTRGERLAGKPCGVCGAVERSTFGQCLSCQRERSRAWGAANPDKVRQYCRQRRANLAEVPSEPFTYQDLVDRDGTDCSLCGEPVDMALVVVGVGHPLWRFRPTVEHTVPISKGGPDTLANATLAHQRCNSAKHDRLGV